MKACFQRSRASLRTSGSDWTASRARCKLSTDAGAPNAWLRESAAKLRDGVDGARGVSRASDLHVLGPAPAALGRLRGEYRAQILIKGGKRKPMREALQSALATRPDLKKRVVVDVDPLSVL